MGSYDAEICWCNTCWHKEWDWRVDFEDYYSCANCNDLLEYARQREAFTKMHRHLARVLPLPLSLSTLFELLHPNKFKHTRYQRLETFRFFLLGAPRTSNFFYDLRVQAWEQRDGIRWKGKNYCQQWWGLERDFITDVCELLI